MNNIVDFIKSTFYEFSNIYDNFHSSQYWELVAFLFGALTFVFTGIKVFGVISQYFDRKRSEKVANIQDEDLRLSWYTGNDFLIASKDYLEPKCSNIDPGDNNDLRVTVSIRESIFSAIDRELNVPEKKYVLVLADSGMGKTTLLLNFVLREQRKSKKNQRRIAIAPLGEVGVLEKISKITDKRNTIILLDALDEDPRAIENFDARISEIMSAVSEFKGVLLTCRTQFFPSDNAIPKTTGIRRVSARRAGESVEYLWRTVYLEPFDNSQIGEYIKSAIPWYKIENREKAKKILSNISDLAARPMLIALIPGLAESNRYVSGLWDLYVFMVDKWIERESSWVEPKILRKLSKTIAVNIIFNRSLRGTERISRKELLSLAAIEGGELKDSMLTSRSLLNRDADGQFKFAHRSILEFFFIQAFVDGDLQCLGVKWTDMMCELFLSWGNSNSSYLDCGIDLMSLDYTKTGLFPIVERHEPSNKLDEDWAVRTANSSEYSAVRSKVPNAWRLSLSHINFGDRQVRAYDFADGLVWQLDITNKIFLREERNIFLYDRYTTIGLDRLGNLWEVVDLYELKLLCDILASKGCIAECIDDRELYWLADNDGTSAAVARIRFNSSDKAVEYQHLKLVGTSESVVLGVKYIIDVYICNVRSGAISAIKAHTILTSHGSLDKIYYDDLGEKLDWSIKRKKTINMDTRSRILRHPWG